MAQLNSLIVTGDSRFVNKINGSITGDAGTVGGGYTVAKSVPSNAVFTDTNNAVTQTATDSTDANYEVLFSATADNTTRTEGARKTTTLRFNPSKGSLMEGYGTSATGTYSHAEGSSSKATGLYSHAEGLSTSTQGRCAHAEGYNTTAAGSSSENSATHAEGYQSLASGSVSHAEGVKTIASGTYSHAEGNMTTASGNYGSHAEGDQTIASSARAHAEGYIAKATGQYSHAEGYNTTASGDGSHAEGSGTSSGNVSSHSECYQTKAIGKYSHAEGCQSTSNGESSHAEGYRTISYYAAHSEGQNTTAIGLYSHAEGNGSSSGAQCAHAEGSGTSALNNSAHSEGYYTVAYANYSHAEGIYTTSLNPCSHASGHYNAAMTTGGNYNNTTGTAFVIGNGTAANALKNAFSVQFNGVVKAASTITASTTADYAEYFEWADENPNNEDRVGYFVTFNDGDKIRFATSEDDYILGVTSGEPFVLGNGDCDVWNGMVLRDEFRRIIYEPAPDYIEIKGGGRIPHLDKDGNPVYCGTRPKLNPNYDPTKPYINRSDRPEWCPVGMLGVLAVRDDGTCEVNGYATITDNAIATKYTGQNQNKYRVIRRNTQNVVEIVFK